MPLTPHGFSHVGRAQQNTKKLNVFFANPFWLSYLGAGKFYDLPVYGPKHFTVRKVQQKYVILRHLP